MFESDQVVILCLNLFLTIQFFVIFSTNFPTKLFYRRLYSLHCSALEWTNIFIQLSLDITFHAIECGVTTCPGYGESWHKLTSLIKWSLTTIVLRLKGIRYCSIIVAGGSLKTLAYHSLPKYWMQKIQKSWNKVCDN